MKQVCADEAEGTGGLPQGRVLIRLRGQVATLPAVVCGESYSRTSGRVRIRLRECVAALPAAVCVSG